MPGGLAKNMSLIDLNRNSGLNAHKNDSQEWTIIKNGRPRQMENEDE
jgi:hypothetical protein